MTKYKPPIKRPEENLAQYFSPAKREDLVTRGELLHMLDVFTKAQQAATWRGRIRRTWRRRTVTLEHLVGGLVERVLSPFRRRPA